MIADLNFKNNLWISTDWHFGKKPSDINYWLKPMTDWVYNWFIPLLKKEVKPGDVFVFGGDLYDNQENTPLLIKGTVDKIIYDISQILPVLMIEGNHDILDGLDSSQAPSATQHYRYYPNVDLFQTSTKIEWCGQTILLQPWIRNHNKFLETVNKNRADIMIAHTDLKNCKLGRNSPLQKTGFSEEELHMFKKVYSGHIHLRQKIGRFQFIGSPYQLDINDVNTTKGVLKISPNGEETWYDNDYSPKFLEFVIEEDTDLFKLDSEIVSKNISTLFIHHRVITSPIIQNKLGEVLRYRWKKYEIFGRESMLINEDRKIDSGLQTSIHINRDSIYQMVNKVSTISDKVKSKLELVLDTWENSNSN